MSKFAWYVGQSLQVNFQGSRSVVPYLATNHGLGSTAGADLFRYGIYTDEVITLPGNCMLGAFTRYHGNTSALWDGDKTDKDGNLWHLDTQTGAFLIGGHTIFSAPAESNNFIYFLGFNFIGNPNSQSQVSDNAYYKVGIFKVSQNGFINGLDNGGNPITENDYTYMNALWPAHKMQYYYKANNPQPVPIGSFFAQEFVSIEDYITNLTIENLDPDPNIDKGGNSTPGGGKGTRPGPPEKFRPGGDTVPSQFADNSAVNTGFLTIFVPTLAQINSLASFLWSEQPGNLDKIRKLFADPMDVIIGLHVIPFGISNVGQKEIMPGTIASGVTANYTTKQYYTKDMGSIAIEEYWGSCLDYAPYTRVNIFLPFIGTRTLDTDVVMGQTLHLYYTVEVTTGALLAQIEIADNVVYEFSGNCAMQIPVNGNDYRNAMQAAIGLAATIGAGIASGGAAAAPMAAATGVSEAAASAGVTAATVASIGAATANAVLNSKPTIERTGSLGGAAGYMGVQKPYLIIEYPEQCLPKDYMKFNGYPAYITATFGNLTGYTQCETVRFKSGRATEEERKEVIQWLQSGVVLGGTAPTKPTALSAGIGLTGYQNGSEDLVVNKSLSLALATQTIYLKKDTEITRPTIILSADTINFNYCYIDAFDRFYYVTGVRNIGADRWEVDLRVDSLTSFSSDIDNSSGVISRQENDWNLYIDDGTFKVYQNRNIFIYNFTGEFTERSYILLVAGS